MTSISNSLALPTVASSQAAYQLLDDLTDILPGVTTKVTENGVTAATTTTSDSLFIGSSNRETLDTIADSGSAGISFLSRIFSQAAETINSPTASDSDKISMWSMVTDVVAMIRYGDAATDQIAGGMQDVEKAFYAATKNSPFMKTALAMSEATSLPTGASPLEAALYNKAQAIRNSGDFTTVTYTDTKTDTAAVTADGSMVTSDFTYGMTRKSITDVQLVPTFIDPTERAGETVDTTQTSSSREVSALQVTAAPAPDTSSSSTLGTATSGYAVFTASQDSKSTLEQEIADSLFDINRKTNDRTFA